MFYLIFLLCLSQGCYGMFAVDRGESYYDYCHRKEVWKKLCKRAEKTQENPLSIACQDPDGFGIDVVKRFIKKKSADVNKQDKLSNNTPLHWACVQNCQYDAEQLIGTLIQTQDINVNIQNEHKQTPLYLACINTQNIYDTRVDLLLATRKIDFSLCDAAGFTIVEFARYAYTHYWNVCHYEGWCGDKQTFLQLPPEKLEKLLATRESVMHTIMRAASTPLLIEPIIKALGNMPIVHDIKCIIAHKLYETLIELIVAKKYAHTPYYDYEEYTDEQRKEIKYCLYKNPTREDIALLWQQ